MDTALPLSCYIRTLNEARLIATVVQAARQVADEVIVVDSGSTDDTAVLAEAEGARVIRNPWPGNGFQKRVGEEAARHDWLLDLDADEVVSPELADSIRALFRSEGPEETVYALDLCLQPPGMEVWRDVFNVPRAKLYDRRAHRMPEHKVWDQLPGVSPKAVPCLDGPLIHHAYRDLGHMVEKMNRGSTARARETRLRPIWELWLRVWFGFPVYFSRQFFVKGAWRKGLYGAALCGVLSLSRWLRDAKQVEMHRARRRG